MAEWAKSEARFQTYGNVAYDPAWGAGAIPAPQREEVLRPRPRVRPKERTLARPRIRVREAGKVSPFAVVGFLSVGVFAALLLMCSVELTVASDEIVSLRSELSELHEQESKLLAQYELAYDLQSIEAQLTADGTMVKPNSSQMVVRDLSEPDSVVVYGQQETAAGLVEQVKSFFTQAASYFTA